MLNDQSAINQLYMMSSPVRESSQGLTWAELVKPNFIGFFFSAHMPVSSFKYSNMKVGIQRLRYINIHRIPFDSIRHLQG